MRAGFPRDKNMKREKKVAQDGAPRHTQSLGLYKGGYACRGREGGDREGGENPGEWVEGRKAREEFQESGKSPWRIL